MNHRSESLDRERTQAAAPSDKKTFHVRLCPVRTHALPLFVLSAYRRIADCSVIDTGLECDTIPDFAMRYVSRYVGHDAIPIVILVYRVRQCLDLKLIYDGNAIYRPRYTLHNHHNRCRHKMRYHGLISMIYMPNCKQLKTVFLLFSP